MNDLLLTPDALAEARCFNAKLARAPRFSVRNRLQPVLIQSLLRLSQLGADRQVRRAGLTLETRHVGAQRVPVRILRPEGRVRGVVLDIHGGGWAIGNARMDDALNRGLIAACQVAVVSVDYRLAPRASVAGMIAECVAAAQWLLDEAPEWRDLPVIVTGESAGGHLAAATLLVLKGQPGFARIAGALLHYGVYDLSGTDSARHAGPDTLVLDGPDLLAGLRRLTPGAREDQRRDPAISPLYADFDGMPPALLFVGALDPLRDDSRLLARRWGEHATAELHEIPEAPHGFIRFDTALARAVLAHGHRWVAARLAAA